MEQRRIEILEKEEDLEKMEAQRAKLVEEVTAMERQIASNTHQK